MVGVAVGVALLVGVGVMVDVFVAVGVRVMQAPTSLTQKASNTGSQSRAQVPSIGGPQAGRGH